MRDPIVSRTVKRVVYDVLMADEEQQTMKHEDFYFDRLYKSDIRALVAIQAYCKAEGFKDIPVRVCGHRVESKMYGMPVNDFIEKAQELDPLTRKPKKQ